MEKRQIRALYENFTYVNCRKMALFLIKIALKNPGVCSIKEVMKLFSKIHKGSVVHINRLLRHVFGWDSFVSSSKINLNSRSHYWWKREQVQAKLDLFHYLTQKTKASAKSIMEDKKLERLVTDAGGELNIDAFNTKKTEKHPFRNALLAYIYTGLAYLTGARLGEIVQMNFGCYDPEKRVLKFKVLKKRGHLTKYQTVQLGKDACDFIESLKLESETDLYKFSKTQFFVLDTDITLNFDEAVHLAPTQTSNSWEKSQAETARYNMVFKRIRNFYTNVGSMFRLKQL